MTLLTSGCGLRDTQGYTGDVMHHSLSSEAAALEADETSWGLTSWYRELWWSEPRTSRVVESAVTGHSSPAEPRRCWYKSWGTEDSKHTLESQPAGPMDGRSHECSGYNPPSARLPCKSRLVRLKQTVLYVEINDLLNSGVRKCFFIYILQLWTLSNKSLKEYSGLRTLLVA